MALIKTNSALNGTVFMNNGEKSIVLLAPTGQVGYELQRSLSILGNIKTICRKDINFEDILLLEEYIKQLNPAIIVNAAAYTAVDKAEEETIQAYTLNAELPEMLAKLTTKLGIWLVHYSSDYVYTGVGTKSWKENDTTGPLSVYGGSKLAGDEAIIEYGTKYLIFRTSWVYAARRNNFMKTMLSLAQKHEELKIVNDQYGAPTPAKLIADITAIALYRIHISSDSMQYTGIYHLCPKGETTWHGFAKEIFTQASGFGIKLKLKNDNVIGIPSSDYPTPACRPKNSRLNIQKLEQTFDIEMPDWKSQLYLTLQDYISIQ